MRKRHYSNQITKLKHLNSTLIKELRLSMWSDQDHRLNLKYLSEINELIFKILERRKRLENNQRGEK